MGIQALHRSVSDNADCMWHLFNSMTSHSTEGVCAALTSQKLFEGCDPDLLKRLAEQVDPAADLLMSGRIIQHLQTASYSIGSDRIETISMNFSGFPSN
jgi:hypothetical protein